MNLFIKKKKSIILIYMNTKLNNGINKNLYIFIFYKKEKQKFRKKNLDKYFIQIIRLINQSMYKCMYIYIIFNNVTFCVEKKK